jgi:hypothetical protein
LEEVLQAVLILTTESRWVGSLLFRPRNLGLSSIVEFSQAELGKTEADITDTDARYRYRLTQIVLAYTVGAPK